MRLVIGVSFAVIAAGSLWVAAVQFRGQNDGPAPAEVQAFADCMSASGVPKADTSNETYYGSEGRVFVPGGEVFVFASQQAAESGATQIEADNFSPQVMAGTLAVVGVPMPDQGEPFPLAESSSCAYAQPAG